MTKVFKRRFPIESAMLFRAEYVSYLNDGAVEFREFNSIKSLNQWCDRNDNDDTFGIMILKKLALLNDTWEPFTTIGKKHITLSDLKTIVSDLEAKNMNIQ